MIQHENMTNQNKFVVHQPWFHFWLSPDAQVSHCYGTWLCQWFRRNIPNDHCSYKHHRAVVQLGILAFTHKSPIFEDLKCKEDETKGEDQKTPNIIRSLLSAHVKENALQGFTTCAFLASIFSLGIRTWLNRRKPLSIMPYPCFGPISPSVTPAQKRPSTAQEWNNYAELA